MLLIVIIINVTYSRITCNYIIYEDEHRLVSTDESYRVCYGDEDVNLEARECVRILSSELEYGSHNRLVHIHFNLWQINVCHQCYS